MRKECTSGTAAFRADVEVEIRCVVHYIHLLFCVYGKGYSWFHRDQECLPLRREKFKRCPIRGYPYWGRRDTWVKRTEPGSSQCSVTTGQEIAQTIPPECKKTFLLWVVKHWHRLPWEGVHPSRYSKPSQTLPRATCSNWPCFAQVGLDLANPRSAFPPQPHDSPFLGSRHLYCCAHNSLWCVCISFRFHPHSPFPTETTKGKDFLLHHPGIRRWKSPPILLPQCRSTFASAWYVWSWVRPRDTVKQILFY